MPNRELLFDRRVVARNIKQGKVTKKEYDQYLASLTDVSSKSQPLAEPPRPASSVDEDDDDDEE